MRAGRRWHWWVMIDISRWPQSALRIVAETGAGVPPVHAINRNELMEGLCLGSGAELALEIDVIDVFLQDAPALVNSRREAIASNDAKGMVRASHTLKSSAAMVAASALARAAATAEAHAGEGRTQEILKRISARAAPVAARSDCLGQRAPPRW